MTVTITLYAWRKPGTTPAEFKDYMENKHVPLVLSHAGSAFPKTHTRHYVQRDAVENAGSDKSNAAYPAASIFGDAKDFGYDVYAEAVFEDEAHLQAFFATLSKPEVAAILGADEEAFADRSKLKMSPAVALPGARLQFTRSKSKATAFAISHDPGDPENHDPADMILNATATDRAGFGNLIEMYSQVPQAWPVIFLNWTLDYDNNYVRPGLNASGDGGLGLEMIWEGKGGRVAVADVPQVCSGRAPAHLVLATAYLAKCENVSLGWV